MLSAEELAETRRRCDAAAPGPWRAVEADPAWGGIGYDVLGLDKGTCDCPDADDPAMLEDEADAVFIAHAREDVPRLLAEVKRLRNVLSDIADIAVDYDGMSTIQGLCSVIDELAWMARSAVNGDPVYVSEGAKADV